MSYKSIFQILLILVIIGTIYICIKKPQMHENAFVYNSEYKVALNNQQTAKKQDIQATMNVTNSNVKIKDNDNIQIQNIQTVQQQVKTQPVNIASVSVKSQSKSVKTQSVPMKIQKIKTVEQKISSAQNPKINIQQILSNNQKLSNQSNNITTPSNAPEPEKIKFNNTKIQTIPQQVKTQPAIVTPVKTQPQTTHAVKTQTTNVQPKHLTAKEEEIAWNIWHSNLTNQVMRDVNLPKVPNGTVFRFKFTVDKYGKITNLQTWSDNSKYTPYAIQYIAPVIRSYQGRSILNFPVGSARVTNVAQSAWRISNTTRYSTPNDFDDVEKIKR
ncbi:hypothetical protein J6G99_08200 [bacterium]|nr:hypothetical protein [bacterium]